MRSHRHLLFAASLACAGVAVAWQTALSTVGWTEEQAAKIAESFFTNSSAVLPNGGSMTPQIKQRWIGRTPAERAQAIRDLALHAKRYVQTPAFEKLYTGWINDRYHAVNHGIKIDPAAPMKEQDVNTALSAAAAEMVKAFAELPADGLRMLVASDIDGLKNSRDEADKRMLARYQKVEALLKTDLAEARKQYGLAKAMQISGQKDETQLQATIAVGAKSAAELKKMEEQRAWNEHNLKAELRRRLSDFVRLAESIDFAAPTQRSTGKMVFSNPEFERKPNHWKLLYRLGKEPTMAAAAIAKDWLREL